ncbi:MAG TPA: DUF4159 domain-containing protein [Vicinamibacterales bacterium]|nr:DUF4159 domain-containing protein [Vicinamibacterales bacterium]
MRKRWLFGAMVAVLVAATAAVAQRRRADPFGGGFGGFRQRVPVLKNTPYDGRFTFVRMNYESTPDGYWYGGTPAWSHGYPVAEKNLVQIMNEVSYLGANTEAFNSIRFDDPDLYKYPIAYVIEPDWWAITESEERAMRDYMLKGGFIIVDDFKVRGRRGFGGFGGGQGAEFVRELPYGGGGWPSFEVMMKSVMPNYKFFDMKAEHPIFHSFFEINRLDNFPQAYIAGNPIFKALYEDNDPEKRIMMIVNYNTDISQYWEWSGRGFRPFDETNEAYKLGVNYLIYGLTH